MTPPPSSETRTETPARAAWETWVGQLGRFAGVGAIATGAQYAILLALVSATTISAPYASTVGFMISALLNYYLNYQYTFRSRRHHSNAMAKFVVVAGAGLLLNFGLMRAMVDGLRLHYVLAQILTTGVVMLWSFFAHRTWTFGMDHRDKTD